MITMFDSVTTSVLPEGFSYAGYVDGIFANYDVIVSRFPRADVLSIAVDAAHDAECLDIETGDATPENAAAWVTRQLARGIARPCLYASASVMAQVLTAMSTAGVPRETLRLWSAHYDGEHVCGPESCRQMSVDADGTQWTDNARGLNLDQSLLNDDFFGVPVEPVIAYLTLAEMETIMNALPDLSPGMNDADLSHWYIRRLQAILVHVYGCKAPVDGIYDSATATAVRALQEQLGLVQDGLCGPKTWARVIAG